MVIPQQLLIVIVMETYNAFINYFNTLKTQGYYPYQQTLDLLLFSMLQKTIEEFDECMTLEDRAKFEELLECWGLNICGLVSADQC